SGKILDTGLSWVGFSIDGINRDTFNKYRCGADYDLVVGNVITFIEQIRKSGHKVKTLVNMTVQDEMKPDVPDFVRFWIDKVDEVLISPFRPIGSRDNTLAREFPQTERTPCYMLRTMMVIYWNGEVGLCCEDWFNDGKMGNANASSLREIWNGEKYSWNRSLDASGRSAEIPLCKDCNSWFNTQPLNSYDSVLQCEVRKTAWQYTFSKTKPAA
ncbi:MAG: SPASM domain-containing protein, partial [Thermodesulfovibrionales bacterium]